ncbi:MAG: sigma-70 family RNA polymerase sigma factor [Desulfobacteraceae bacterium]|nr:sigma-70 family RNA polymerase sigma factor [Desulfobacteraceae bacterium]
MKANSPNPEQWVDLYSDYLYRYAIARLPNKETAEDAVQEAFVSAIQAYGRFQGKSSIKTWLVAILKRKIVDHYRRSGHKHETNDIEMIANKLEKLFDDTGKWKVMPNAWNVNPDAVYEQKEFIDVLYKCIAKLPKRLAEIFMLREFEEQSTQSICNELKISESNSWVMLYRARMQLKQCLESNWLEK